jgi:hypothetical protein
MSGAAAAPGYILALFFFFRFVQRPAVLEIE